MTLYLGIFANGVYVSSKGNDGINCGSEPEPCRSLLFAINNISRHSDTIYLIGSRSTHVMYRLETTIVIKHSLTITKYPKSSINPVITYHTNVASSLKKFFAFKNSGSDIVGEVLSVNFNSINFNVKIFATVPAKSISARTKVLRNVSLSPLLLSISDSTIRSHSDLINLGNLSGYENVSICVKDSIIENGALVFDNKKEICTREDRVRNKIEMINVTFSNVKDILLFVNGCFDVSLEKFMCTNITLKKQPLFTFKKVELNLRNILFKTIVSDSSIDHNKSEKNPLVLICESTAKIHNLHVKDCKVPSSMYHKTLLLVQKSKVQMDDIKLTETSIQNFAQTINSTLCIKNISFTKNNFTNTVWSVEESNVELKEIKLDGNEVKSLLHIDKNSNMLSSRNILFASKIFKNTYYTAKSSVQVSNAVISNNRINNFMTAFSKSYIYFKNALLTKNLIKKEIYYITWRSKLEMDNVVLLQNNIRTDFLYITSNSRGIMQNSNLAYNIVSRSVYYVSNMSLIQLNNVVFTRNLVRHVLYMNFNSDAIIQNKTLTGNKVLEIAYYLSGKSYIKLTNAAFTRNYVGIFLLLMYENSIATIQNNTLTENKFSCDVYFIYLSSNIVIKNVAFTRNHVTRKLMIMRLGATATMQNNSLTENKLCSGFIIYSSSTIAIKNSAFTRNIVRSTFLYTIFSSFVIQNKTLTENKFFSKVYIMTEGGTSIIKNVAFTRNYLGADSMSMTRGASVTIENETMTENKISSNVYVSEGSNIIIKNLAFTRNEVTKVFLQIGTYSNAVLHNCVLTESDVLLEVYRLHENSSIQLNNITLIGNNFRKYLLYMNPNSNAKLINNTIIGNKYLGQVFYLEYANLAIDTVLVQRNTLKHLILATFSSVSVDFTTIIENNIEQDMIHTLNCRGMLANSFIKNFDYFSTSAFSIIDSYESQKYRSFGIINTEIVWNSKLPFSARPILKLSGKMTISNVTVSVSSISVVIVVEHSTDVTRVKQDRDFKTYSHNYRISLLFISCIKSNLKNRTGLKTIWCVPCAHGRYTLNNESLLISSMNFESKRAIFYKSSDATCLDCPAGANCTVSIKSKSNFYGYKTQERKLRFLPCPSGFCCTGNQCDSITSCDKKRTGNLCGTCIENFTVSFLSSECISKHSCKNFMAFWAIFWIYALVLATFLYYMKDLINILKSMGSIISQLFRPCLKKSKRKTKNLEDEIDETKIVLEAEEDRQETRHFTVSGIFALIISFYQIKQVITVDLPYKHLSYFTFNTFVSRLVNLEVVAISSSFYCPMNNLNEVSKVFIKTYLLTVALLMVSSLNYFISRCSSGFRYKYQRASSLQPLDRLGVCFVRILMLNYKNVATVSLTIFTCVEVAGSQVLYIKGDVKCFQWWQITMVVFFCTWVLFFPLSLKYSYKMLLKDEITFPQFICCLLAPCALVACILLNRNVASVDLRQSRNISEVKMILKEMFEECYRSKATDTIEESEETIFYETCRLYQRVILAIVATFFINPLVRITLMIPVITLIALSYLAYRPYKPEMYILHWMEVVSILGFFLCLIHNMMRGFLFIYDINIEYPVTLMWHAFDVVDLLFSPICVLFCFFIVKPIFTKAKTLFKQKKF